MKRKTDLLLVFIVISVEWVWLVFWTGALVAWCLLATAPFCECLDALFGYFTISVLLQVSFFNYLSIFPGFDCCTTVIANSHVGKTCVQEAIFHHISTFLQHLDWPMQKSCLSFVFVSHSLYYWTLWWGLACYSISIFHFLKRSGPCSV